MKTAMLEALKKWTAVLGMAVGLAAVSAPAQAQVFVSSDSLTVTITPQAAYSLDVDTAAAVLNLGTVGLSLSTFTASTVTVTVGSSYASTELRITGQVTSGGWTLDTNTATAESDSLQAWAVFTDTGVTNLATVQGLAGAFSGTVPNANGSDVLGTGVHQVGTAAGVTQHVLTPGAANYKSMDDLPTYSVDAGASAAHLWLKFTLPPTTTNTLAKTVTITLGAGAPIP